MQKDLPKLILLVQVRLRAEFKYYTPQVWPNQGSNLRPPDHDSTFHATETPALSTWPSMTSTSFSRVIMENDECMRSSREFTPNI